MEFTVTNEVMPVIEFNFEELKAVLDNMLNDYRGVIVTEESLGACKDAQKELASLRIKIDNYRKEKKKLMSAPITAFENKCKELIACIEQAEKPIKEGIEVFDDKRREEKRQIALKLIDEVADETGLNEEYKAKLDVLDKYTNLTAKQSDVRDDLETRAFALKVEQDRQADMIATLQTFIDMENAKLSVPMSIEDFRYNIKNGQSLPELLSEVKARAERLRMAECSTKEEKPQNEPSDASQSTSLYEVSFKVTADGDAMRKLSAFLKDNGYAYQTISQKKVS